MCKVSKSYVLIDNLSRYSLVLREVGSTNFNNKITILKVGAPYECVWNMLHDKRKLKTAFQSHFSILFTYWTLKMCWFIRKQFKKSLGRVVFGTFFQKWGQIIVHFTVNLALYPYLERVILFIIYKNFFC